ncbi:MAG TPA: hypothetical protein VHX19_11350 [Stellaceae bacterium]|jgi:hypothetical protein|nr:hypothetical protein [Stellaceae bacterium]
MMVQQRALATLAIAFFLMVAFQTFELVREHANLENAQGGQQAPLEQTLQMRQETEGLAGDIAALADKGNANAKQIVEGMRQQGITLRTPQAAAAPASK